MCYTVFLHHIYIYIYIYMYIHTSSFLFACNTLLQRVNVGRATPFTHNVTPAGGYRAQSGPIH